MVHFLPTELFAWINLFSFQSIWNRNYSYYSSYQKWGKWGSEQLCHFPKATQSGSDRVTTLVHHHTKPPLVIISMGVQFSCHSVLSDSLWPNGLKHARPPCPSPTQTQTHVHQVSDAIQPPHPLSSASPPAFNLSQHQGLFQWVGSSHQVAKVLKFQVQHQSFQWIFRTDFL